MPSLLFDPNPQFCDADGVPYAGGLLYSYVVGTTTLKTTWSEHTGTALNSNPIVLDAAGRCIVYGDGEYRLVLQDAAGNLVFDQYSTTIVSAAMQPVVVAPTIADAVALLGVNDLIDAEATARAAADSAEQIARINGDSAEAAARNAEDIYLANTIAANDSTQTTNLNNEIARAEAAEANLSSQITGAPGSDLSTFRTVVVTTDGLGNFSVAWSPAFAYAVKQYASGEPWISVVSPLAVQAGANFTGVTMFLDHCSGVLSNRDGLVPSPAETPAANRTFTFRVDGW